MTAERPWLQREDWAAGRVASTARANLRGAWIFTVLWNLVSAPILVFVPREIPHKPIAAIGFLFPLVGAGLLAWAVLLTMRWRRFGPAVFEMTSVPAAPGGVLTGAVHTRLDLSAVAHPPVVSIRLTCVQRTISHSSDREVRERILWRDEQDLPAERLQRTPFGTLIPVQCSLPPDALETTTLGKAAGILWSLDVNAELPGVDLSEEFEIPVYRTTSTRIAAPQAVATIATMPAEPITAERLEPSGIEIRRTAEGTEYHFTAARNPRFALGATAFTIVWTGAIALQWFLGFPWIIVAITALFDVLMMCIVLDLWCGDTRVIVGPGSVRRRHGWFGIGAWRTIQTLDVSQLTLTISMQTTGRRGTPYYEIIARLKNGRRVGLGDGIRNKRHAEWLIAQMKQESGI